MSCPDANSATGESRTAPVIEYTFELWRGMTDWEPAITGIRRLSDRIHHKKSSKYQPDRATHRPNWPMAPCKPLYGVRREQQRPHLRSHRRGLGRLPGADVAP